MTVSVVSLTLAFLLFLLNVRIATASPKSPSDTHRAYGAGSGTLAAPETRARAERGCGVSASIN